MGSGVGRRAALEHDRHAPGLVHLAAARVGRADRRVSLRELRQAAERSGGESEGGRAVRSLRRRCWFTPESDTILPAGTKCPHCGGTKFEKETDIFDVWLESGASYLALVADEPDVSLAVRSLSRRRRPVSRMVSVFPALRHGHARHAAVQRRGHAGMDARRKRSGHVEVARQRRGSRSTLPTDWAAEVVRLWVASVDFREDVVGSEALMQRVAENYRKIRNTFRYMLGNLDDFDPRSRCGSVRQDGSARSVHAAPDLRVRRRRARLRTTNSPSTRFITA